MSQVSALDFANHMATYAEPLKGVAAGAGCYSRAEETRLEVKSIFAECSQRPV